ncbi:unnamed protein product [Periconia digitata]|uniref:Rhodopsin domain-containing protein n=1 Tax=Periconia digitata TaxID=1303443 RepID=A0A9W4UC24_9PLEO|nr:unnamed protein product [Periconia digitata]
MAMTKHTPRIFGRDALEDFLTAPLSTPPPGVDAKPGHAKNRNKEAFAFVTICLVLATLTLIARVSSRVLVTKKWHIEDYFGLFALVPFVVFTWAAFDYGNHVGFYVHQWDLQGRVYDRFNTLVFIVTLSYGCTALFLKTAVLLEWQRIFALNRTGSIYFRLSVTLITLNVALYITAFFLTIFACRPVEKVIHAWVQGQCLNLKSRDISIGAHNLALEVFIFCLPQRIIWRLQLHKSRKIGLSIVFSVGILTIALSIARLYFLINRDRTVDPLGKSIDAMYHFSQIQLLGVAELTCTFLVFCAPVLPKLFSESSILSRMMVRVQSWTRGARSSSSQSRTEAAPWPRTIGSWSTAGRVQRRINDEEFAMDSVVEVASAEGTRDVRPEKSAVSHHSRTKRKQTIEIKTQDEGIETTDWR